MRSLIVLSLFLILIEGYLLPRDLIKSSKEKTSENSENIKNLWVSDVDVPKAIIKDGQKVDKGSKRTVIPLFPTVLIPAKEYFKMKYGEKSAIKNFITHLRIYA